MTKQDRILLIDDDLNILLAYRRILGRRFQIEIAEGARNGLNKALSGEEWAVILCDLHMPELGGLALLGKIRELRPNTVRVLFTGDLDLKLAIQAVNSGAIYRYLCKPCSNDLLIRCIEESLHQYQLQIGGESLLRDTLGGVVRMMSELLAAVDPQVLGRAPRLGSLVRQLADQLRLRDIWEFELAAALSQLGLLRLDESILQELRHQHPLEGQERARYSHWPELSAELVQDIPRLESLQKMIEYARSPLRDFPDVTDLASSPRWLVGAQLLKAALDYDRERNPIRCLRGPTEAPTSAAALHCLSTRRGEYFPEVLRALSQLTEAVPGQLTRINLERLRPGMVVAEDVISPQGRVLMFKGQTISSTGREFLFKNLEGSCSLVIELDSITGLRQNQAS